jgi:activator of 2-hydroxyglutaryl-CoA dehydratase
MEMLDKLLDSLFPEIRTVFEMGGETSKFILLEHNDSLGKLTIADYGTNGDCAAGTGAFMDQQASRLPHTDWQL